MKKKMIARKSFTYGTRALKAGDEFTARRQDARTLAAVRMAAEYTEPSASPIEALRSEALASGIKVDQRWGEKRLREEIEAAKAE